MGPENFDYNPDKLTDEQAKMLFLTIVAALGEVGQIASGLHRIADALEKLVGKDSPISYGK
jgi:hypothetical protein